MGVKEQFEILGISRVSAKCDTFGYSCPVPVQKAELRCFSEGTENSFISLMLSR